MSDVGLGHSKLLNFLNHIHRNVTWSVLLRLILLLFESSFVGCISLCQWFDKLDITKEVTWYWKFYFASTLLQFNNKISINFLKPLFFCKKLLQRMVLYSHMHDLRILLKPSKQTNESLWHQFHCVKSVRIRSFSGPYFPAFELNSACLRIQFEYEKIRTRKTQNTGTFHAVFSSTKVNT